jgi:hypothetical protein
MDLLLVKENEDGSADYTMKLTHAEQADLIRFAFIEMLKRGLEEGKQYDPEQGNPSVGDTGCGEQDCLHGPCFKSGKSELQCVCDQIAEISDNK